MIPVHVVTGFLGSGKTTLLREVLANPAFADSAVIVNEFGEIGLDHLLLEEVEEGVLLLESGCICCTIRSDLKETIRGLHDKAAAGVIAPFRRIVVETTGLADPAPIVATVAADPLIRSHYRTGNIVCTVDAVNGAETLARHPEAVKQAAVADRLLITKTDLVPGAQADRLAARISALNPAAPIVRSTGAGFDAELLFGEDIGDPERRAAAVARWLAELADHADRADAADDGKHAGDHRHSAHGDDVRAFALSYPAPIDWTAFGVWLTALLHAHGDRLLRVKGLISVRDSATPVVLHGVQHVVHPPMHLARWPDEDRASRIVFITRGLDEAAIRASLDAFMTMAARLASPAETG